MTQPEDALSAACASSGRILKSDLAFEGRTCGAKLNTPGLITDDTIRRYSAPRLERLDRSFRAWTKGAVNCVGHGIPNAGAADGEYLLQTLDDLACGPLLYSGHGSAIGKRSPSQRSHHPIGD